LRPPHLVRVAAAFPHPQRESGFYSWDELATAQRRAVLALVHENRRHRQRAHRRTVILTLLLILLLAGLMALLAFVVFGLDSPATFSF
jgi:hypothetical protein